jgi:putative spermidine/putrescine transport system ATP-binding protein
MKRYGRVMAVRDLELDIEEGIFFSLLGPSGCGKTTTLRMIAGFIRPTIGKILLGGRDITGLPPEKRNMGMVFQNYAIFPHMNVFDNISFGLRMRRIDKGDIKDRVNRALKQVGLSGYQGRYTSELSGGEQQRVALARVLVIEPEVLLLDEPLSALDKQLREEMQFWIKELQRNLGITTVYVTHDQVEAMTVSDRLGVMNKGRLDQIGSPQEVYENPRTRFVATFIGESNVLDGVVGEVYASSMTIQSEGLQFEACKKEGVQSGGKVTVLIRPEKMEIFSPSMGSSPGVGNMIEGTVVDRVYRGANIRYSVRLSTGKLVIVDTQQVSSSQAWDLGDHVRLAWKPSDMSFLLE